jgi:hypothetical protein
MAAPLTQADLLAVIDRTIPDSYLAPIREIGPGYEIWQGIAKVGERCSAAVANFERDVHILTSQGGRLATVPVTFYRLSAGAGAGVMLAGTLVRASRGGQVFRTLVDAPFGATDLTTTTTALATGYGYEWNIRGPFVDPRGVSWPGDLDTIDLPLQFPVFWDSSILVRNDADADGMGRPRTLDMLGGERGLARQPAEDDQGYRVRIRTLPDTVTPAAIRRQFANFFRRMPGLFWRAVETWQHEYQECYDAPDVGPTAFENYDSTLFCYDDPRPRSPIRNRYLGENDYLGAFIVEVGMPASINDFGFAYDDPDSELTGTPPSVATRAMSAYDAPDFMAPPGRSPAYDVGFDLGISKFFGDLYALLDQIKAAGIFVVIHLQEQG